MKILLKSLITLASALLVVVAFGVTHAQDATEEAAQEADTAGPEASAPHIAYYIAADTNGINQVYQQLLGGQNDPRQITFAERNVITFGAAYDGLGIAYISDGQLWLQSIHTEEPESVATVEAEQFFNSPVFSQDGNYIAYANNGVWLLDLATRETTQILEDVRLAEDGSNMPEYRIYAPKQFVLDAEGNLTHLVIDAGVWEWNTDALYELSTGELQLLGDEDQIGEQFHTNILPLSDGRVLLYGNSGVGGEASLHIAESLEDINSHTELVNFRALVENTLFATQAVEIEPGIVRVFGPALDANAPVSALTVFSMDVDINDAAASVVTLMTLTDGSETGSDIAGELSSDGSLLPVYEDALFYDYGPIYGRLSLVDLATGETTADIFPETVSVFHFQTQMPEALQQ
jgi:hypothetical protein